MINSNYTVSIKNYKDNISFKNKFVRLVWNISCLLFFRPFPTNFLRKWRILILKIFGAKIDWSCCVYCSVKIWAPWNLQMGPYSVLGPDVDCYNPSPIKIGAHCIISQKSYLCSASHDISSSSHPLILDPIVVEDQVWVAADTFIGPGVKIGQGAVVGARSCVTKDVESWTVVGGNPALFIKKRIIIVNNNF